MVNILVVDDDLMVLATIAVGLKQVGYQVHTADSAVWALKIVQNIKPDIAILDIRMPVTDGIDLAKQLKEKMIPFIFLTAYSDDVLVQTAGQIGAFGYLVKPIEISSVVSAIEIGLIRADEYFKSEHELYNLRKILEKNREIDISIGLLMERHKMNRVQAFELLRNYARSNRLKIINVSNSLISGALKNIS